MAALDDVKSALRVTHSDDDALLTRLISSATREYFAFADPAQLPVDPNVESSSDSPDGDGFVPEDAFNGIVLMVQADYDGAPEDRMKARAAAEALWMPYRRCMGV
jgi:hypothetical protein